MRSVSIFEATIPVLVGKKRKTQRVGGSGVAVSKKRSVIAVHGDLAVGTIMEIVTRHGTKLSGKIGFMKYEPDLADIAVVDLDEGHEFPNFVQYSTAPVKLLQTIVVIAMQMNGKGEYELSAQTCEVTRIEGSDGSSLFQSTYYSVDGMSGAGVVTILKEGRCEVVGVHVASHDTTIAIKQSSTITVKKVNSDMMTINSNIHGHHAYCLVCEIFRVEDLLAYLDT